MDLEEVQGLQAAQGMPPLKNKKTLEEVLSSKFLQAQWYHQFDVFSGDPVAAAEAGFPQVSRLQ